MTDRVRILCAENNPQDSDRIRAHLAACADRFELEVADTARKFLERVDQGEYDVLLLDNNLPELDGAEILRQLAVRRVATPVVVVTGTGDEALIVQLLRLGASDCVPRHGNYLETLPSVLREAIADDRARRQGRATGRGRYRLLYVEHDLADIDQTVGHLAAHAPQFDLEVARSTREALDLIRSHAFDGVVANLRMPDMSGLELLRALKRTGAMLPVVIIAGRGDEEAAVAALKLGALDYLMKRDNYLTQLPYAVENAISRFELLKMNRRFEAELAERKRAEESLLRLAAIVESSDDAILSKSLDGTITSWNRGAERLYGHAAAEVLGKPVSILIPAENTKDLPYIYDRIRRGECVEHYETTRLTRDGQRVNVSLTISPIRDASGTVIGASAIARDVSERRRLEEQFAEAQKLESVGRLAGGVAHDFNNLLTVINGYCALALDRLDKHDELYEDLIEVSKAGERAAELTKQLLAFSRRTVLQPKVLSLNTVLAEVTSMLRRLIGEDIELTTFLDPELAPVEADPGKIGQVIANLAVNARDAMPQGGKLTITTANVTLDESYLRRHARASPGRHVVLTVSDTGHGMDAATQSQIFEPFFTTKESGTGLGLSTVYGIVRQSGGNIEVYSEIGLGTTFKIYLPQSGGDVDVPEPKVASDSTRGTGVILLVEDEDGVRKLVCNILRGAGYTVLEARTGMEALRLCEANGRKIDLMITDVVMPQMSGRELAKRLESLHPGMKVLYMSGYTDDAIVHHGILEPGIPFIEKPFTAAALTRRVRSMLHD